MRFYVREVRERQNMSQRELAQRAKVGRSYIERIEAGEANPSLDIMCRIAQGLGVSVHELFDGGRK